MQPLDVREAVSNMQATWIDHKYLITKPFKDGTCKLLHLVCSVLGQFLRRKASRSISAEVGSERTGKWLPESENIFLSRPTIVKLWGVRSLGTRLLNGTIGAV